MTEQYTIRLLGDVMLGRLIDQLFPTHVDEPEEAELVSRIRGQHTHLHQYNHSSPWGNSLVFLRAADLVLANLETSVTTHTAKWPDKVFNYRMHPENIKCLTEATVNYVSLSNNHTLDFSKQGLFDTIRTVAGAGIAFAGAGQTKTEADKPAVLTLSRSARTDEPIVGPLVVHVHSFSDHPSDWRAVEEFNHLEYTAHDRARLQTLLTADSGSQAHPALKIVSVHWGPNYRWQPDQEIRDMAHYLIDACGVDVVWGHSSHHIQGVEVYRGKFVIYGCGDFVDDYAVNQNYRNDLSAVWTLKLARDPSRGKLQVQRLEMWPNRVKDFQAQLLDEQDSDHAWVRERFQHLCADLGTTVESSLNHEGQIVVDLTKQQH